MEDAQGEVISSLDDVLAHYNAAPKANFGRSELKPLGLSAEELADLRARLHDWDLPIAADESVRKADDPLRVIFSALAKRGGRATVVAATSGDTGSAAIAALGDLPNIQVFVLHPKGRVSDVQRRQMTTVRADNVHAIAVEGDFDDPLAERLWPGGVRWPGFADKGVVKFRSGESAASERR